MRRVDRGANGIALVCALVATAVLVGCSNGSNESGRAVPTTSTMSTASTTTRPNVATTTSSDSPKTMADLVPGEIPDSEIACLEAEVERSTVLAVTAQGAKPPFAASIATDMATAMSKCLSLESQRGVFEHIVGIPTSSYEPTEEDWEVVACWARELPSRVDIGDVYERLLLDELDEMEQELHQVVEGLAPICGEVGPASV